MSNNSLVQNISILNKLPNNWEVLPFNQVLIDCTGGNKKVLKSTFLDEGLYPIIDQGKSLIAGYTNNQNLLVNTEPPYIIFGDHTRTLKFVTSKFAMGADGTKVLKAKTDKGNEKFLYYFMLTLNIPNTGYNRHFKYIKSIIIPLPPLPEQKKIAAILDAADQLKQKDQQLIEHYNRLSQSLFLDMFGDPVTNPKEWKKEYWQDVLTIRNGKNQKKVENPKGLYPIFGSGGKVMGYADKYLCEAGTVILGRKGSINNPILIKEKFWNVDTAFGLCTNNRLNNLYLYYFCVRYNFMKHNKATTLPSLTKADLLKIKIPLPPITLQNQFAERIKAIEAQKQQAQLNLKKSTELFNSLLQRAFLNP